MSNTSPTPPESIECPQCEGTGQPRSRTSVGRISTYSSLCDKCGGEGRLYPVNIELEPADIRAEAQSG